MLTRDVLDLIAATGTAAEGADLFRGLQPDEPDACVTVTEYGGGPPVALFGEPVALERPRVQIRARGEANDYDGPAQRLQLLYLRLAELGAVTVNRTRYLAFEPVQQPFPLGKDTNERWVFAVNFAVTREPTRHLLVDGVDAARVASTERGVQS